MGEIARVHVSFPREVLDELDRRVGPRGRSEFVAEAVKEKLALLRRAEVVERFAGSLADADIPEWETPEAAAKWLRELRDLDRARLNELAEQP